MIRLILSAMFLFSTGAMAAGTLADSAEEVCPILLGSAMPDVSMQSVDGKPTSLKKQVGDQPAILVFYRGG